MSSTTKCDRCGKVTDSPTYIRGGNFCGNCTDFCVVCHTARLVSDLSESGICVFCESEANRGWRSRKGR